MDAGGASGLLQLAAREICNFATSSIRRVPVLYLWQKPCRRKRLRRRGTVCWGFRSAHLPRPCGAGCERHRLRRVASHPAPRRSQRHLTPFFHGLLADISGVSGVTPMSFCRKFDW
jgi:hypothetical protein